MIIDEIELRMGLHSRHKNRRMVCEHLLIVEADQQASGEPGAL